MTVLGIPAPPHVRALSANASAPFDRRCVPAGAPGRRRIQRTHLAVLASAWLVTACADERRPADPAAPARPSAVRTFVADAGSAVPSEGFDPADSYASYEVETTRRYTTTPHAGTTAAGSAPIRAAVITRPRERTRLEFGYDARGRERMVMTPLVDPSTAGLPAEDRVGRVVVIDGEVQVYGVNGI